MEITVQEIVRRLQLVAQIGEYNSRIVRATYNYECISLL